MNIFWQIIIFSALLFTIGLFCLLATLNLIRVLIGLEILIKAVTLLIIGAGYVTGKAALAQSLVITLIVIEVVLMTVAVGIVLGVRSFKGSLDARNIRDMKG